MKLHALAAVAAFSMLLSNVALADNTTYFENGVGKDQNVIFQDDPLAAGGLNPNEGRILVVPHPKRVMLVRPRTQFVTEMLKSVENM
jgi:hypothetical protein